MIEVCSKGSNVVKWHAYLVYNATPLSSIRPQISPVSWACKSMPNLLPLLIPLVHYRSTDARDIDSRVLVQGSLVYTITHTLSSPYRYLYLHYWSLASHTCIISTIVAASILLNQRELWEYKPHPRLNKCIGHDTKASLFEAKNAVENKKIRPKIILNTAAIALNCLVFEKIAFSCTHLGETDGRTDGRTNGWTGPTH